MKEESYEEKKITIYVDPNKKKEFTIEKIDDETFKLKFSEKNFPNNKIVYLNIINGEEINFNGNYKEIPNFKYEDKFCVIDISFLEFLMINNKTKIINHFLSRDDIEENQYSNFVITYKSDASSTDTVKNNTILHLAILCNNPELVNIILESQIIDKIFSKKNEKKHTALNMSIFLYKNKVDDINNNNKNLRASDKNKKYEEVKIALSIINSLIDYHIDHSEDIKILGEALNAITKPEKPSEICFLDFETKTEKLKDKFNKKVKNLLEEIVQKNETTIYVEIYRNYKDFLDKDNQNLLEEKLNEHEKKLAKISKTKWDFIETDKLDVKYTSKNKKKSIPKISFDDIHNTLAKNNVFERNDYLKDINDKNCKTNFILANLTFICSDKPWEKNGEHSRKTISFPIKVNGQPYFWNKTDNQSYSKILGRIMTSGDTGKYRAFLESVHTDNEFNNKFTPTYMHSEQALFNYLSSEDGFTNINTNLEGQGIKTDHKIYGVILDINSTLSPCYTETSYKNQNCDSNKPPENSCRSTLFGFQNSQNDKYGFLYGLKEQFKKTYKFPIKKTVLPMIIRFSALTEHHTHTEQSKDNSSMAILHFSKDEMKKLNTLVQNTKPKDNEIDSQLRMKIIQIDLDEIDEWETKRFKKKETESLKEFLNNKKEEMLIKKLLVEIDELNPKRDPEKPSINNIILYKTIEQPSEDSINNSKYERKYTIFVSGTKDISANLIKENSGINNTNPIIKSNDSSKNIDFFSENTINNSENKRKLETFNNDTKDIGENPKKKR
ncbi:MAG: hypothetical protein LEGION0398_MBIBDBAK_00191 [Legionellaceae bacterium]